MSKQNYQVWISLRRRVVAVLRRDPRRRLVGRRRVAQAKVEPEYLPRALLVDDHRLRADVAMEHLDRVVKEVQPLAQLHQTVLDLNIEQLVLAQVGRHRRRNVVVATQNIGQTRIDC